MGSLKMEDVSLPTLYDQARKITLLATDSTLDKETLRKGYEALQKCEDMISKLGLFSTNETKDEISTTNLKYILVPFYLAELIEKTGHDDDRIQILKASQAKLKEFLSFCDAMELLPEDESLQESQNTAVDRRAKKIARFKRQRAAESKLLELKERKERRGRSTRAAALSTPVDAGDDDVLDDDGEEEREAWLTTISLAICKALDLMEMLKKEEEMLSAIKEKQEREGDIEISEAVLEERAKTVEDWHRNAAARARYTKAAAPITCATFAQDVLEGRAKVSQAHDHKHQPLMFGPASLVGGSITSERERIAAQVFQPGHRLPTMSIEEAGLKEMEMMNKWQENTAKMIEEANSSWHNDKWKPRAGGADDDDDDDEDDEAAQDRARAFDDWKDENPRGAGNSKLTPCG
ncbi:putative TAP46-like protein [Helianthus annuus]|nr:putative TAP46-like protein [Helianthus annuus]KAJ0558940.1 putative TAP46-like protein [Helianthus annuus]KAJ0564797.1 putative TAP46-like protein [Helianthus annuus]KAJ0732843.1 putative TAP46-like protein [Helianthus annuus]KAJ0906522.1 putative TAP46-like protein [Helianthus annuus]